MEDLVKKTGPYDKFVDRSSDKFKESPYLNRWADKKDLQSAAHAFALNGGTIQLEEKIGAVKKEVIRPF